MRKLILAAVAVASLVAASSAPAYAWHRCIYVFGSDGSYFWVCR